MKLYTVLQEEKERVCLESPAQPGMLVPLPYEDMNALLTDSPAHREQVLAEAAASSGTLPLAGAGVLAPIPRPLQDVICLGMNYIQHKAEAEQYNAEAFTRENHTSVYFSKRATYCPGPGAPIPGHFDLVDRLDYECELAVVLGKDARNVSEEEAMDYVFGYTIVNDVSARNVQTGHKQWYFGKSLDGFTPMGPCLVTKDEFPDPPAQAIRTYINGELRQNSVTDQLIFGIRYIISELSRGLTLKAGTVIATGTPAGVGMGFEPPKFLKAGDLVRCEIEGIGILENPVE